MEGCFEYFFPQGFPSVSSLYLCLCKSCLYQVDVGRILSHKTESYFFSMLAAFIKKGFRGQNAEIGLFQPVSILIFNIRKI